MSHFSVLKPCTTNEIANLDNNCSIGIDGISTKVMKCATNQIVTHLTQCYNKLLLVGTFPDTLEVAKVASIYKSGPKTDPDNYRPISVLPVLSKILERILYNRLYNYLINFIYDRQYRFRPKSSTLSATINLVSKIKHNIDCKNIELGIYIDFKKKSF